MHNSHSWSRLTKIKKIWLEFKVLKVLGRWTWMRSSVSMRKKVFDAEAWGCEDRFDTDAEKLATKFAEHLGVSVQGFHM
jgi:hypothetical protein